MSNLRIVCLSDTHNCTSEIDVPEGDILIYTPSEWEAFVEGVRDGEFDIETWEDEPIVEIIDDDEDEDEDEAPVAAEGGNASK